MIYKLKKIAVFLSWSYRPDLRALSLMRIGVALVILADLIIRMSDLRAHYTNEGVWPLRLIHLGWKNGAWSLHTLNGTFGYALTLFIIHFLLAGSLLFGYRTRIVTILLWLMTISLHNRNLFVQQAGDDLLRLVLFWGMFLPWNAYFSSDNLKFRTSRAFFAMPFFAGMGYFLLIASVYAFSLLHKTSEEWWSQGTAVYYALSLEQIRLPAGDLIYHSPSILKILTWFVITIEFIVPVLILWPSTNGRPRTVAFILLVFLHAGIGLTLYVGIFFVTGIVSALGLLPYSVFRRLGFPGSSLPASGKPVTTTSRILNSFCVIVIILCLIINTGNLHSIQYELRQDLKAPVHALRLDQRWAMFSPGILKKDGWFVLHGMDSLGRQRDLSNGEEYVDYKKPARIVSMYKNDRWRKFAENMQDDHFAFLRPVYCQYILHKWNSEHPAKKVKTLHLYFMEKESLAEYRTTEVKKNLHCVCYEL